MLVIQDVLISDDIADEQFQCNLSACKGACCREGDYGAPVTKEEMDKINTLLPLIAEFLPEDSQKALQSGDGFSYYKDPGVWGTACHPDGSCVFLKENEAGIAFCGIEAAYTAGKTDFIKPLSCHLYPIRVSTNEIAGFEAWNYDRWDICSAACTQGKSSKMPVFRFVKDAIIRLKGRQFYEELEAAALYLHGEKT
jgi:hypothetical protein